MQQINLYLEEFKQIEPKISAAVILILMGYALFLGLLISAILGGMLWSEQSNLSGQETRAQDWQGQLQVAQQHYPAPQVDASLLRKIENQKGNIERNKTVLRYLNGRQLEVENQAFSVLLLALTWVNQDDLWLTRVAIRDGGQSMSLTGLTLSPESLPKYLDKLSKLDVFSDMSFRVFDLKRDGDMLSFEVSSQAKGSGIDGYVEKITKGN